MTVYRKKLSSIIVWAFPLVLIITSVLLAYWNLPHTFFQQDEWLTFGKMIVYEETGGVGNVLFLPFLQGRGHFTPLSYYQLYLEFKLFGLSFENFAYVSIATHIINSVMLFYFVSLLLKNRFLALCSSLIFAVGVVSNQAVSWIAASPNTQGAILFLLLSLIFIFKFLQSDKKKYYYIGLTMFLIGLLYKETILLLFILAPLMWVLCGQKKGKRHFYLFVKPLIIFGVIYFFLRTSLFLIPSPASLTHGNIVNLSPKESFIRVASSPFKILPQAIIPQQYLINISDAATLIFYPQYVLNGSVNPYFSQTVVFGQVIPFLSVPIILIGFILYKLYARKDNNLAKGIIFSLLFVGLSGIPFAFIPGDLADLPIYESRHLHAATAGASIFLVLILYGFVKFFLKQSRYVYFTMLIVLAPFLLAHFYLTRTEIEKVIEASYVREDILETIKLSYPNVPEKVVFYTQSDTAYYGMPQEEKALPFQINFGLVLQVWYQKSVSFPPCLFDFEPQAFNMLTQRYKECGGRGFGYFRDYDKLISTLNANNLSAENVIAHSWRGKSGELKDITDQARAKIKKDL